MLVTNYDTNVIPTTSVTKCTIERKEMIKDSTVYFEKRQFHVSVNSDFIQLEMRLLLFTMVLLIVYANSLTLLFLPSQAEIISVLNIIYSFLLMGCDI